MQEYKFTLHDLDHVFKAGHTVMVEIQSTWFPLYDRNPQTFVPNIMKAKPSDYKSATITIYSGPGHDSSLQVPMMSAPEQDETPNRGSGQSDSRKSMTPYLPYLRQPIIFLVAVSAPTLPCKARKHLARELDTARLAHKDCISEVAQCYHFVFEVEGRERFDYLPGQFVSAVAPDEKGKLQTRAYSIASAAGGNRFRAVRQPGRGGLLFQSPRRPARPARRRDDPDSWAAWALCAAGTYNRFDPYSYRHGDCAHARLYAVALPSRRPRPQQRQGDLAGLRHPLRDRHLLSRRI